MVNISLTFPKDLTKLAGNKFGRFTYEEQVKSIIDSNRGDSFLIEIPERIDRIASSFIQGFFEEYVEKYGLSAVEENIVIKSTIDNINQLVLDNLE